MSESKEEKKALETFKKPYSCAQAIYGGFEENPNPDVMDLMKKNSSGNAPDRLCGALFAARYLTDPSKHAALDAKFLEKVGSFDCRQIVRGRKITCEQCLSFAVRAMLELE